MGPWCIFAEDSALHKPTMAPFLCFIISAPFWLLTHGLLLGVFGAGSPIAELHMKPEQVYEGPNALVSLSSTYHNGNTGSWNEGRGRGRLASASLQRRKKRSSYRMHFKRIIAVIALATAFVILRCALGIGFNGLPRDTKRSLAVGGEDPDSEDECGGSQEDGSSKDEEPQPSEAQMQRIQKAGQAVEQFMMLLNRSMHSLVEAPALWRLLVLSQVAYHAFREASLVFCLAGDRLESERIKLAHALEKAASLCLELISQTGSRTWSQPRFESLRDASEYLKSKSLKSSLTLSFDYRMALLDELLALQTVGVSMAMEAMEQLEALYPYQEIPPQAFEKAYGSLCALFGQRRYQIVRHPILRGVLMEVRPRYHHLAYFSVREISGPNIPPSRLSIEDQVKTLEIAVERASTRTYKSEAQDEPAGQGPSEAHDTTRGPVDSASPMGAEVSAQQGPSSDTTTSPSDLPGPVPPDPSASGQPSSALSRHAGSHLDPLAAPFQPSQAHPHEDAVGEGSDAGGACGGTQEDGSSSHEEHHLSEAEEQIMQTASEVVQGYTMLLNRCRLSLMKLPHSWRLLVLRQVAYNTFREFSLIYSIIRDHLSAERIELAHALEKFASSCLEFSKQTGSLTWSQPRFESLLDASKYIKVKPLDSSFELPFEERIALLKELVALQRVGVNMAAKEIQRLEARSLHQTMSQEEFNNAYARLSALFHARRRQILRHRTLRAALNAIKIRYHHLSYFSRNEPYTAPQGPSSLSFETQLKELEEAVADTDSQFVASETQETAAGEDAVQDDGETEGSVESASPMGAEASAQQKTSSHKTKPPSDLPGPVPPDPSASGQPPSAISGHAGSLAAPFQPHPPEEPEGALPPSQSSEATPLQPASSGPVQSLAPGAHLSSRLFFGAPLGMPAELILSPERAPGAHRPRRPFRGTPVGEPSPAGDRGGLPPGSQSSYKTFPKDDSGK